MENKHITLDIYSDIACPWCYVGKRKLSLARQEFLKNNPSYKISISWHPYIIDPKTNKAGEEYLAYNKRRWGGDGWTYSLKEAGKKIGCNFLDWKTWPNTLLAHCLVSHAESSASKGDVVLDEIFELSYEKGENVSNVEVLDKIAQKFNINEEWKKEGIRKKVIEEDSYAKNELDIHGVPFFVVNKKFALEGAVEPEMFMRYFIKT